MNLYDVIKKPVITESSMGQLEAGKYVFEVDTVHTNFDQASC